MSETIKQTYRLTNEFNKKLKEIQSTYRKEKTQAEIFDEMIDIYKKALKREYDVYVTEAMEGFLVNRNLLFYRKIAEVINGVLEHVDERNDYITERINEILETMDEIEN